MVREPLPILSSLIKRAAEVPRRATKDFSFPVYRYLHHLVSSFAVASAAVGVVIALSSSCYASENRPNIVLILTDDLGWCDTTLYGTSRLYRTPNLDRLSQRGLTFNRAYAASPLCSPTRASIMTGKSPARIGITSPVCHEADPAKLNAGISSSTSANSKTKACFSANRLATTHGTLAKTLRNAGYISGHIGKWHLGFPLSSRINPLNPNISLDPFASAYASSPLDHGFDLSIPNIANEGPSSAGKYLAPWNLPGPYFSSLTNISNNENLEDRMAREAVAFIESHKDVPFFLNYWQFSVHGPWEANSGLRNKYAALANASDPQRNPTYAAMVETMDTNVGKILDTLDRLNLTNNTVIIFTSDNGGNMYNSIQASGSAASSTTNPTLVMPPTSNFPLRGGKSSVYEGGIRVPCIISWPGLTRAGTRTNDVMQSMDLYPTILDVLALTPPVVQTLDGVSIARSLRGLGMSERAIFTFYPFNSAAPDALPPAVAVHKGDWKLIRRFHNGAWNNITKTAPHVYELYNLSNDSGEHNNLAAANAAKVQELDAVIEDFLVRTQAVRPVPNPAYVPPAPSNTPSVPVNIRIQSVSSNSITVSWNSSTDDVGVTGYEVYKGNASALLASVGNVTSATISGLTPSTLYNFKVRARDVDGHLSVFSSETCAITLADGGNEDTTPPSIPQNLVPVVLSSSSIQLSWSPSTDNVGGGIAGYDVYRNGTWLRFVTATSIIDVGLAPSTLYHYAVVAKDTSNNYSRQSVMVDATTSGIVTVPTFVMGVDMNGVEVHGHGVSIDGRLWSSYASALAQGLTLTSNDPLNSPARLGTSALAPIPAVDADKASMLGTAAYAAKTFTVNQPLANGNYNVYLWSMENYQANWRKFNVIMEGSQVATGIGTLALGAWMKYGPYATTVTDGQLNMTLIRTSTASSAKDNPILMGFEIYRVTSPASHAARMMVDNHMLGVWSTLMK